MGGLLAAVNTDPSPDSASQLSWNYNTAGTSVSRLWARETLISAPMIDCLPPCNSSEYISQRPRNRSSVIAGQRSSDPGDPYICAADGRSATLQFPRNSGPQTPGLTSSEMQPRDNTSTGRYRTQGTLYLQLRHARQWCNSGKARGTLGLTLAPPRHYTKRLHRTYTTGTSRRRITHLSRQWYALHPTVRREWLFHQRHQDMPKSPQRLLGAPPKGTRVA